MEPILFSKYQAKQSLQRVIDKLCRPLQHLAHEWKEQMGQSQKEEKAVLNQWTKDTETRHLSTPMDDACSNWKFRR